MPTDALWATAGLPPLANLLLYLPAMLLCIAAPGPDMLLALGRGIGQGPRAAAVSALGTGCGIACHSMLVAFGLTAVLQSSVVAFSAVKLLGAGYLVLLGIRAIRDRSLVQPGAAAPLPFPRVFMAGCLSNVLNPKVAIFVLAFVPQFADASRGAASLPGQILWLGAIFAVATVAIYATLGACGSRIERWLVARPRWVAGLNVGCGAGLLAAGVGVLALRQR